MNQYTFEAEVAVELDIQSAFDWYEAEDPSLGFAFIQQLSAAYRRILENPAGYQELRSGIRRALTRQFPYAVYFSN